MMMMGADPILETCAKPVVPKEGLTNPQGDVRLLGRGLEEGPTNCVLCVFKIIVISDQI
jgi:hypothetical protein